MADRAKLTISRRALLLSASATAIAAPAVWTSSRAQGKRLVIRDPGGEFSNAFKVAFFDPFAKERGVEVVGVSSANEPIGQIKGIVESRSNTWDIAGGISMAAIRQLVADGDYIEKHKLDNEPVIQEIPAEYRDEYAIGVEVYATGLCYRKDKFKEPPQSYADFFNVEKFPGRRAMRKNPADTLEIALFADGVQRDAMYPLDVERAFKKLTALKPHITTWWTTGAQATQLLATGEIDMLPVWVSRGFTAAAQGAPVGVVWNQNIWGTDVWAILKGTPNLELCREFIKFASDAKRQAALAPFIVNGPTNPNAFKFIAPERAPFLTTNPAHRAVGMRIDDAFWAKNRAALSERFNAWLLT